MPRKPVYPDVFARIRANVTVHRCGCWLWTGRVGTNHRPQINIRVDGQHRTLSVARLVIEQFYLPGAWEASHVCPETPIEVDPYLCVHPEHLIPETKQQNMARRWGKPLPSGVIWPRRPGPVPVWQFPAAPDADLDAGIISTECPF